MCEEGPGICAHLLTVAALFMVVTTLPLSLLFVIKVVQVCAVIGVCKIFILSPRNMNEQLYFAWVDFYLGEPVVLVSFSSFHASTSTRRST